MKKIKAIFKSKKFRIFAIIFIVLLVIGIMIAKGISNVSSAMNQIMNMTSVVKVEKRDLSETIAVSGTVAGSSVTNVNSSAASDFTAVNVAVGDFVNEGDVICTLDKAEIQKQIDRVQKAIDNENSLAQMNSKQNETNLANTKADMESSLASSQILIDRATQTLEAAKGQLKSDQDAQAALDTTAETYQELKAEYDRTIAADKQAVEAAEDALEDAKNNYEQTKTSGQRAVDQAQATIDSAAYQTVDSDSQSTLEALKKQIEDCEVKAPISGIVTAVNVKVGDNNTPGAAIITIEDTSSLKVTVSVDESDINKLEEGMPATVTTTATGDEVIEGTVTRVVKVKSAAIAEGQASGSGYTVEVTISNPNILIGMTAKVKIVVAERGISLAVPYDSIRYDDSDKPYVLLSKSNKEEGNNIAVRCDVELGDEVDYYTEITGGDLKEGDMLVNDVEINEGDTFISDEILDTVVEEQ